MPVVGPVNGGLSTLDSAGYRLLTPGNTGVARVYDDGKLTFVQFSSTSPPAGLMVFDENGKTLAYTVSGNTLTVHGVHAGVLVRTPTHSSYAQASGRGTAHEKVGDSPEIAAARAQVLETQARLARLASQVQEASNHGDAPHASRIRQELDELDIRIAGIDATLVRARFAEGQAHLELSDASRSALVAAAKRADHVIVRGGIDAGARERSQANLALARAISARRMLIEGGVPARKIRSMYYTKVFVGPNATPEGRRANRRVEFILIAGDSPRLRLDGETAGGSREAALKDLELRPRSLRPVGRSVPRTTFRGIAGS